MQDKRPTFKRPPKKHQPKGLEFLYEDHDILVVNKVEGLLTMGTGREKERTAYYLLTDYVKKGNPKSKKRIFIVHRLDRDTSGVLIFAKNEAAKRYLQDEWENFDKTYTAVVQGILAVKEGEITSYLDENQAHRVYSVNDPAKGRLSKTGYRVVRESQKYSLLEIRLETGRKHQIRVHFSEMGHAVVGDRMYGVREKGVKRLALHATSIAFNHPVTKERMNFSTVVPAYFKTMLR